MPTQPNEPAALILRATDDSAFREAVVLGQGLPLEKNGSPVKYFWKEVLRPGRYIDKTGKPFEISPQRIDNLLANFTRAKSKSGWLPHVPCRHEFALNRGGTPDPRDNLGFVVDARKTKAGSLELLHQIIGTEAHAVVARNKSSIGTLFNVTDENGEFYDEFLDHNAVLPDPHIGGLSDFTPALAASRGQSQQPVVVLSPLAASESQESEMDITKLREAIGAAKEITDEQVIAQAAAKLAETVPALELSRTQTATIATLTSERDAARAETQTKALELSRATTKPERGILDGNAQVAEGRLQLLIDRSQCTQDQAKLVRENFLKPEVEAGGLMLSRSPYGGPLDAVFKLLELNKTLNGFQQTTAQAVGRSVPGAGVDHAAEGRALGQQYQKDQLAARGVA
jgi:hypothetical protein